MRAKRKIAHDYLDAAVMRHARQTDAALRYCCGAP
jgi:hypothetical protein